MNNTVIAVLVLVIIVIVGWLAYSQGYLDRSQQEDTSGINIEIGGSSDAQ